MTDYKEYTRLRDIAQKRIKRGQAAGLGIDVHIPTVKELRQRGEGASEIEMMRLQQFINTGFSLERRRAASRPKMTEEERRQRKREYSREYRRRKVAKEYERPEYPNKYQGYLKGLKTLGVDVPPSKLPAFFAYMDARFAQGSAKDKKYVFDIFVEDFQKILKSGYNPNQILGDFQKFEANQAELASRAGQMLGTSYAESISRWDAYLESKLER